MKAVDYSKIWYHKELVVKMMLRREFDSQPQLREIELSIQLKHTLDGSADCQVGHFGWNFYVRTPKGMKAGKYTSEQALESAVIRVIKQKIRDVEIVAWRERK